MNFLQLLFLSYDFFSVKEALHIPETYKREILSLIEDNHYYYNHIIYVFVRKA